MKFLRSGEWNAGFGVFARYGNTHLMDTEHVTWRGDHWGYDHIRFWPSSGTVNFYAFAPYSPQVRMGSLPDSLANQADINSPNTYIDFPSNMSPVDLVWANQPNQTAPKSPNSKVQFQFKHALVRLGFDITANQKLEEKGAVITVDKVILYGANETSGIFLMGGHLNLKTGNWYVVNNEDTRWYYTWTPTGNDGEGPDVGKGPELKLDGDKLSNPNDIIKNSPHSYIFIIPQEIPHQEKKEDFYLEITYTVGNSTNPVTVKKNLLDVLRPGDPNPSFTFERGKAYDFHLKLSPNPIHSRVTTNAKNWDVDVVNNVPCNQIGR